LRSEQRIAGTHITLTARFGRWLVNHDQNSEEATDLLLLLRKVGNIGSLAQSSGRKIYNISNARRSRIQKHCSF
jgi:hypothetical protein